MVKDLWIRTRKWNWLVIISLFSLFVFTFWINSHTWYWADDYCLMNNSGWVSAIKKSVETYKSWSGRLMADFFSHIFINWDKQHSLVFNMLNSLFFVFYILAVFRLATRRLPAKLGDVNLLLFTVYLAFFCFQAIGEATFWKTGSIGYLWGMTGELIVLSYVVREIPNTLDKNKIRLSSFRNIAVMLSAMISATFLQNVSLAISFICWAVYFANRRFKKKRIMVRLIMWVAICHSIGTAVLLSAKGNFIRYQVEKTSGSMVNWSIRLRQLVDIAVSPLGIAVVSLLLVAFVFRRWLKPDWKFIGLTILLLMMIIIFYLPIGMPLINRTAFPLETILLVLLIQVLSIRPQYLVVELIVLLSLVTFSFPRYKALINDTGYIYRQVASRNMLIVQARIEGKQGIVIPEIVWPQLSETKLFWGKSAYYLRYLFLDELTDDPNHWKNKCFADAYGFGRVISSEGKIDISFK